MRIASFAVFSLAFLLSGCAIPSTAPSASGATVSIRGVVHGGQQPLADAKVYLFAANTSGYGNASVSLLNSVPGIALGSTTLDSSGGATNGDYYTTTDANGAFAISGDYTCTPGQQVYLYSTGGNPTYPEGSANTSASLMAALGTCPSGDAFPTSTFVVVNEVTTVATAYALAGFAVDALHIADDEAAAGNATAAQAKSGLANAFANVNRLVSLANGSALASTPSGAGTVPQALIDTLANTLAACVNSVGAASTGCSTLFANAKSAGSSGTAPSDTATAAINIAHHPAANVQALFGITVAAPPFAPSLATQPNDFAIGVQFTGGGISNPRQIAIDQAGNAWIANQNPDSVIEISSAGSFASGAAGYTGNGLKTPVGIAIDASGNAWIGNRNGATVTELSSAGQPLSGTGGFPGGGIYDTYGIAIDRGGDAWLAMLGSNQVTELSSSGAAVVYPGQAVYISEPTGIALDGAGSVWVADLGGTGLIKLGNEGNFILPAVTGGGLTGAYYVAIDSSGDAWVADQSGAAVSKFSSATASLAGNTGYTGGGLTTPTGLSIDGAGTVWVADQGGAAIGISSAGSFVSGTSGYTGGVLSAPLYDAVDGSGDLWVSDASGAVVELIGLAAPAITPICAGLPATPTTDGSSSLGTRP